MVMLSFEDANGRRGKVTETLEIDYSGPWKEDIEETVQKVETDCKDDPYTRLILELPEEAPIVEIEQVDYL